MVASSALAAEGRQPRSPASWSSPTAPSTCPTTSSTSTATRSSYFTPGDHGASIRVDGLELGLSICYDGCFPEHARAAAEDGAVAYLSSSAYFAGGEHRRDLYYAARAVENGMYVVFAGLTGPLRVARLQRRLRDLRPRGPPARPARHRAAASAVADLDTDVVEATRARHTMLADHRDTLGERDVIRIEG